MRASSFLIALAIGLASTAMPARSAIISGTYSFTATAPGFPGSPVTGSFDVTFDNTVSVTDQTTGITVNSLNLPLGSQIAFNYTASTDRLVIGGINSGAIAVSNIPATNDFAVLFTNASTNPVASGFLFQQISPNVGGSGTITASSFTPTAAVPEPASLALFGAGLLGLGLARHRRLAWRAAVNASGKHSGLGLSISRQIVQGLRGRIATENRRDADGKVVGARFIVRLPVG